MFKKILNPNLFHGERKKKNFFEGWYYKICDRENKHVYAFIPGIIKGKLKGEGHSFVQILDGANHHFTYLQYTQDHFNFNHEPFTIEVSKNSFSLKEITLNHVDEHIQIVGNVKFVECVKWPDSKINPGSMGFYNYLLFMECYSQVCCLDGKIVGKLMVNNKEIDFTGGKVYIEKNWGRRFPTDYIWVQGNKFLKDNIALSVSLARVPLGLYHFNGFLTAFLFNNQVYKFTTMNHSKMKLEYNQNNVILTFEKDNYQLYIETRCKEHEYLLIKGPRDGVMVHDIKESIESEIKVELIDMMRESILFQGVCQNAGVEMMGNLRALEIKKGL